MNTKFLLFALLLFSFGCTSTNKKHSSEKPQNFLQMDEVSTSTTDKDEREIHFTESWTWEYLDENREWNEIVIHREPSLNYWLFDKYSSYGMTNGMCEWVVGTPEGKYWFSCQDAEFGSEPTLHTMEITFDSPSSLPDMWEPTHQEKEFGDPAQVFEIFTGESYDAHYLGQKDPSRFYIMQSDVDMRPVYYFNQLDGDGRLPIIFPVDMPKNVVVLSEDTDLESHNIRVNYRFKDITPASFYAYLPE